MTWVRIDDGFPDHPKVDDLSDSAFRLYITVLCWCSRYCTDGRVTKSIAARYGSAKTVRELLDAGLWQSVEAGYEVHDYLAYNPSKAEVAARREAVGARVKKHRDAKKSNPVANDVKNETGNDGCNAVTYTDTGELPTDEKRGPIVRARVSPTPTPSPTTPQPPGGRGAVPCPEDLALTPDQRRVLEAALIPGWAIDEITTRFRAGWAGSTDGNRTVDQWRRSLSTTVTATWNDASKRPRRPEPEAPNRPVERVPTFADVVGR